MLYKAIPSSVQTNSRPRLSLHLKQCDGVAVLECKGRIRFRSETELFRAGVQEALDRGTNLVIDLKGVESIDSAGIGELVMVHMLARGAQCEVCIAGVNDFVRRLLDLTNVASLFEIRASVEAAVASLHANVTG